MSKQENRNSSGPSKRSRNRAAARKSSKVKKSYFAYSSQAKSRISRTRTSNDSEKLVISGEDLVMPTPETLATKTSDPAIFLSVTSNPLYWTGTRVSSVAAGYQMFRPLMFEVEYVPQVPVTYSGNVIYGTLFSDGREMSSLQQSLASSNGGGITPCYSPAKSRVRLGEQLPQRLFRLKGNASDAQVNPFRWVATYSGSNPEGSSTSAPGWVVVRWRYEFMNGVGNGGDAVITTYTTPVEQQRALQHHLARHSLQSDRALSPLFGTVIGILKLAGVQILRNIAVLFLENTKAITSTDSTLFGAGAIAAVIPPSKTSAGNDSTTVIRDQAGNEWKVADDTPVVIYQQGPPVSTSGPIPPQASFLVSSVEVKFIDYGAVQSSVATLSNTSSDITRFTGTSTDQLFTAVAGVVPGQDYVLIQMNYPLGPRPPGAPRATKVIVSLISPGGAREEFEFLSGAGLVYDTGEQTAKDYSFRIANPSNRYKAISV